jgi:hypothetical protein
MPAATTAPAQAGFTAATPPGAAAPGEAAARRDLRDQIARLERELALELAAAFPRREPLRADRSASARGGPRLLSLGELERVRDELAERIAAVGGERPRERLEQMLAAPERHRWARLTSAELGEPGCTVWAVRPRLGLLGMLMGWWRVKISSGCPLPG